MNLAQQLANWDGKSKRDIEKIYRSYSEDADFIDSLIHLSSDVEINRASTWLLKHFADNRGKFSNQQAKDLLALNTTLADWQSRLHYLQLLDHLPVQYADKPSLEHFIRSNLSDENKFVRAWAYNGFYLLARAYPEFRSEAEQFFNLALQDEPASVKARVRKLIAQGFA